MKLLMKLISRMFLAVALCMSAPVAFAGDSSYDIDKERVAQEIREQAMSGDLEGATEAVETYEDSFLAEVKLLIASGGDVNAMSSRAYDNHSYLGSAVIFNDARAMQLMLENGAKTTATNEYGFTPLNLAAGVGWGGLDNSWTRWYSFDEDTEGSRVGVAKVLIDYGADVNAKDDGGWTPLNWSAFYNTLDLAKLLIDNGADVNAKGDGGWTPLRNAVGYAVHSGETELVQLLIDNGADVNARTTGQWNGGETPLYMAILMQWTSPGEEVNVIKLLIDNGADVNAKADGGWTPLHVAIFIPPTESKLDLNIMKLLIDNGADVNALSTGDAKNGYTPLDVAVERYLAWASRGSVGTAVGQEAAKLLIEHGAYCNVVTGYLCGEPVAPPEPKADYTGLYANAAFAVAGAFAPSWVDTQTFAFNQGDKLVTGQSLSVPLDDFTFAASRVQVNDLTDYEFSVKWEMEF